MASAPSLARAGESEKRIYRGMRLFYDAASKLTRSRQKNRRARPFVKQHTAAQ
jgi:hypothetical protein